MGSRRRPRPRRSRRLNDGTVPGAAQPDPRGDIPRRVKCTYNTISCALPRTTQQLTQHFNYANSTIIVSNAATQAPVYNFTAGGLPAGGPTSWDQYRFEAVRFSIYPDNNALGLTTNSTTTLVPIYCVIDYDDSTALASAAAAQGYDNCIQLEPAQSLSRVFKPRMALAAYAGAFNNYANVAPMWIDAVSSGVQHYGVKLWVNQATAAQTQLQSYRVNIEVWLSFRSQLA